MFTVHVQDPSKQLRVQNPCKAETVQPLPSKQMSIPALVSVSQTSVYSACSGPLEAAAPSGQISIPAPDGVTQTSVYNGKTKVINLP